jgi:hypothetical protein
MKKMLGEYSGEVPLSIITAARTKPGGLAPELVELKGVRYAVMQEPSPDEKINVGPMKMLTSGTDVIQCRAPYMPQTVRFNPQFKLCVCSNTFMKVESQDFGTWRRIRKCDFLAKFIDDGETYNDETPYVYIKDKSLRSALPMLIPNKFNGYRCDGTRNLFIGGGVGEAALLEAMQERSVTIAGQNYKLDLPYFVLATQNPIEQEGTYPLPEAQLDRFMFAIKLDYPSFEEEVEVVKSTTSDSKPIINPLFSAQEIIDFQHLIRRIPVADNVIEYAVTLVSKTRPDNALSNEFVKNYLDWGAGPRASQNLILAAKANAAFNGKFSPDIEDVKAVAVGILRHRIIKNYKADAEGITEEMIIDKLL